MKRKPQKKTNPAPPTPAPTPLRPSPEDIATKMLDEWMGTVERIGAPFVLPQIPFSYLLGLHRRIVETIQRERGNAPIQFRVSSPGAYTVMVQRQHSIEI